ncbi:FAD-dependent oxidoreductase [Acetomicrobium hydrogeniformans]|uniref:Putative NADH oxidase n=1 Tax=Acetomicrobium hydrogeniformans ATCC BAA-1850 TaxID=592015 RepID=A0A0T5XC66_9BACT|nr:FAD-dependent oxidoreductase [Acetomicrobium hydrogeniformans]KRT35534.1 putative NADH oxidase [Acetomicrobium hydrogeniformans ATCC BAA-1850]
MQKGQEKLFEPIRIGSVVIPNRIAMAPMGIIGMVTEDGCFADRAVEYYVERARGGTGLIITGAVKVENEIEKLKMPTFPCITLNPLHFITRASELTERVHAYGSKIFVQVTAGLGHNAHPIMLDCQPVAPSAIPNYWEPNVTCRELKTEEVERLVERFAEAAEIAVACGFDGIEIHAMHEGYLLDQFTMSFFNRRTDKYGGDLEGRLTFPIEIIKAIKSKVGKTFPVILRFSVKSYIKGWNKGGLPGEQFEERGRDLKEGLIAAKILEEAGYDGFNADAGSYEAWYWAHPPNYMKHGCYIDLIRELKKVISVPVLMAGRMELPDLAAQALEEKTADVIVLGRGLLADPEWPNKVKSGQEERIRPCLGCQDGCLGRIFEGKPLSCAVNPACGREREMILTPAQEPKKICVIGGGLAGMEAARVAALRGHDVTLYEKGSRLGGHLLEASVPEFKKDEVRLLEWYEAELANAGVKVKLNTEITLEQLKKDNPDVVIVATGSVPKDLDVPGLEKNNVIKAEELLLGRGKAGQDILVVGGGLVGCETALWLAQQGKSVTIVEMLDELMSAGVPQCHANKMMLLDLLDFYKVKSITGAIVSEVTPEGVILTDKSFRRKEVKADTIVIAIGLREEKGLYDSVRKEFPNTYLIGDAMKVRNFMFTIWDAFEVAKSI